MLFHQGVQQLIHVAVANFGARSCPPTGGHGTAMREYAVVVPLNPALQYVHCYAQFFIQL